MTVTLYDQVAIPFTMLFRGEEFKFLPAGGNPGIMILSLLLLTLLSMIGILLHAAHHGIPPFYRG